MLVTVLVINRLDDYFTEQQQADLAHARGPSAAYVAGVAERAPPPTRLVVGLDNRGRSRDRRRARQTRRSSEHRRRLGQADVDRHASGVTCPAASAPVFVPADDGTIRIPARAPPATGQTQERRPCPSTVLTGGRRLRAVRRRGHAVEPVHVPGDGARQRHRPARGDRALRARPERARRGGHGPPVHDPAAPPDRGRERAGRGRPRPARADGQVRAGSSELAELAVQFNAMADRLEESVEIIRRDRDRSRDFLADVSHELRTPLAALRTFNELLREGAGDDPEARAEFLESSGQQIERLDWLAQNLLELSKLDSGLVLLDLRPDDLRAAVESAVEQSAAAARKRGVDRAPPPARRAPIRIRHDPQRIGQVVAQPRGQRDQVHAARRVGRGRRRRDGRRRPDRRDRHRRRDRPGRAAAHLRALLPRLAGQRGPRQRQRPGARDRPLDRRHARRHGRRSRAASARDRGSSSRCRAIRGWSRARRPPSGPTSPRRPRRPARDGIAQRGGNFTVRAPAGEPGARTLRSTHRLSRPLTGRHPARTTIRCTTTRRPRRRRSRRGDPAPRTPRSRRRHDRRRRSRTSRGTAAAVRAGRHRPRRSRAATRPRPSRAPTGPGRTTRRPRHARALVRAGPGGRPPVSPAATQRRTGSGTGPRRRRSCRPSSPRAAPSSRSAPPAPSIGATTGRRAPRRARTSARSSRSPSTSPRRPSPSPPRSARPSSGSP